MMIQRMISNEMREYIAISMISLVQLKVMPNSSLNYDSNIIYNY